MTTAHATVIPDLELDDVEGHGFKEIAIGLSTAGVLATGVAGAVHVTAGPVDASAGSGGASVTAQVSAEHPDLDRRTVSGATHAATEAARHATHTTTRVVDAARATERSTLASVTSTITRVTGTAQQQGRATAAQVRQLETEVCLTTQKATGTVASTVRQTREARPAASVDVDGGEVSVHMSLPVLGDQDLRVGLAG